MKNTDNLTNNRFKYEARDSKSLHKDLMSFLLTSVKYMNI